MHACLSEIHLSVTEGGGEGSENLKICVTSLMDDPLVLTFKLKTRATFWSQERTLANLLLFKQKLIALVS